jgi:hypothetical protein
MGSYQRVLGICAVAVLVSGLGAGSWQLLHRSTSPVPGDVQRAVRFPVYYPDPKRLPAGYALDVHSFKAPVKDGVTYVVRYGTGKNIVFSVQSKPSDSDLQSFNASYIPLRNDYRTMVGQAEIGAYLSNGRLQTLVSLPTDSNAWLIITAPPDINHDQLQQVLQALQK